MTARVAKRAKVMFSQACVTQSHTTCPPGQGKRSHYLPPPNLPGTMRRRILLECILGVKILRTSVDKVIDKAAAGKRWCSSLTLHVSVTITFIQFYFAEIKLVIQARIRDMWHGQNKLFPAECKELGCRKLYFIFYHFSAVNYSISPWYTPAPSDRQTPVKTAPSSRYR